MPTTADLGPVLVVGAGLLGTSVGLALRAQGVEVWLEDLNHEHVRTASGLGAGTVPPAGARPRLVVVAVPPDHIAEAVVRALATGAVVTDVGSVKSGPLAAVGDRVADDVLARYVGSHPMAGSERSGPLAASATLFDGRPWAVTAHVHADPAAVDLVVELVERCGGRPVRLSPVEHDRAVARTSHLPHLLAVLAAAQLADAPPEQLALSGQGVRDVTRVAAGDPDLYAQIIRGNSAVVLELLRDVRADLDLLLGALAEGAETSLAPLLDRGVAGTRAIPGKHGRRGPATAPVYVEVPDTPGELARLLAEVGETGVNLEDLRIDHDLGRPMGLVELLVTEATAGDLQEALAARGWSTHR
ncbi:MAG: prephenate dehydrogenase [Marmoricola sp.]